MHNLIRIPIHQAKLYNVIYIHLTAETDGVCNVKSLVFEL